MVSKTASAKKAPKKSSSSTNKYASKYVGEVISKIINDKMKTVKNNPKATEKWCQKMKLSIQRKVSESSKTLFSGDMDIKTLEAKYLSLRDQVRARQERITSKATVLIKANSFHDIPAMGEAGSYTPKQFESQTKRISNLLNRLATQIEEIRKEIPTQVQKLKSVVQVIDNSWQQQLQQSMIENDRFTTNTDSSSSSSASGSGSVPPNAFPTSRLQSHLSSYQ